MRIDADFVARILSGDCLALEAVGDVLAIIKERREFLVDCIDQLTELEAQLQKAKEKIVNVVQVHTHRSSEFFCPHCGQQADSNSGPSEELTDGSIGVCIGCGEPFFLHIVRKSPLSISTRIIPAEEFAAFDARTKKMIGEFTAFVKSQSKTE